MFCTSIVHQIRCFQAELLWETLPEVAPASCVCPEGPIFSTGCRSLHATNGIPQFVHVCSQTHHLSKGGSGQRTGGGHKTTQHCRSQESVPVEGNNLKGWSLLYSPLSFEWHQDSWQSKEQLKMKVKMRRVFSAKQVWPVACCAIQSRFPELKALASFRCFWITVLIWWEGVLQHYLATTNCLWNILLGNDRS